MLLVFEVVFSMVVIAEIEFIGGGQVRGGRVGGGDEWEAIGGLKQTFIRKRQCCAISRLPRLAQLTGEARSAVRISLAPHAVLSMPLRGHMYTGHEMHICGLTASEKSRLQKQTWPSSLKCFWLVSLDNGFQFLCP